MADAFRCDRCKHFEEGSGTNVIIAEREGFSLEGDTKHEAELCDRCASALHSVVDDFLNGQNTLSKEELEEILKF